MLNVQYIAAVTHHSAEFHDIKYQLLQSNPVLEGKYIFFYRKHALLRPGQLQSITRAFFIFEYLKKTLSPFKENTR